MKDAGIFMFGLACLGAAIILAFHIHYVNEKLAAQTYCIKFYSMCK